MQKSFQKTLVESELKDYNIINSEKFGKIRRRIEDRLRKLPFEKADLIVKIARILEVKTD